MTRGSAKNNPLTTLRINTQPKNVPNFIYLSLVVKIFICKQVDQTWYIRRKAIKGQNKHKHKHK